MQTPVASLLASLLLAIPAFCQDDVAKAGDDWIQDFAAAKAKAKAEHKDLLIDFTGSDWCIWCKRLHDEVFATDAFMAQAPKQFVFVKLDFPRNKDLVTDDIRAQNAQLQMEFAVKGYPSIFLADADGRPYAQTGYQQGGPEKYLPHLDELRAKKTAYDAAMAKANGLKGAERAKALNTALSTLAPELVLQHYADQVNELIALDADGKLGFKADWQAKLAEHESEQAMAELQTELGKMAQTKEWDQLIARCDEVVAANKSKAQAQMATIYKAIATMDGKNDVEAAVALLAKAKAIDPESKIASNCDRIAKQMRDKAGKAGKAGGDHE